MDSNTYPTSTNGIKCISKCYPAGTRIIHPVTTEKITNTAHTFCAIDPYYNADDKIVRTIAPCDLSSNVDIDKNTEVLVENTQANLLQPLWPLNYKNFLSQYYLIKSQIDFNNWLVDHEDSPVLTRIRIIDCFLHAFGKDIAMFDEEFINAILSIIKQFWIKKIYNKLYKYISVKLDEDTPKCIVVVPEKNKLKKFEYSDIRRKYMESDIIGYDTLFIISNKYLEKSKKNIMSTDEYLNFILDSLEKEVETNITKQK
jgi:hypothetical protein